ncbi:MAG: hypothetical protein JNJ40_01220 [Bacteroidia bacterium]|nr:hypothetical protein [Bacteroidia bacterium]
MKHYVLFFLVLIQFWSNAQKTTSVSAIPKTVTPVSVISTDIILNPLTGNNFLQADTKASGYAFLYSYEDFKTNLKKKIQLMEIVYNQKK